MDLPTYNLPSIFQLRKKLAEEVSLNYFACNLTGGAFEDLVDSLLKLLPGTPREPLRESVRHLAGKDLTQERVDELCWRLAGNARALKKGAVVPPWSRQEGPEWAPAQALEARPGHIETGWAGAKVNRRGGHLTLRLLAGTAAGWQLKRFWTNDYVHVIKEELGFSPYDRAPYRRTELKEPDLPFHDVRELVRMRMFLLLAPESGREGPSFTEVKGSPTTVAFNRALLRQRLRLTYRCPLNYPTEEVPCYACELGYDKCQAACHPKTFVRGDCPACGDLGVWFDPAAGRDVCVDCAARSG
jgi:hypothetical protein